MAEVILSHVYKGLSGNPEPTVKDVNLGNQGQGVHGAGHSSGCGKSTTLRMIAGLEEITGAPSASGCRRQQHLPKIRDFAMVFQNYALYPYDRHENMAFGLRLRHFRKTKSTGASVKRQPSSAWTIPRKIISSAVRRIYLVVSVSVL